MIRTRDPNFNPSIMNPNVYIAGVQYEENVDAAYGDHIVNTTAVCNTSASHTYGNVLAVVEKFLSDKLISLCEFKTIMANTALASRQVTHLPHQLHKKELPLMALVPRISFGQDDNRFLGHTLINERVTDTHAIWGDGSLELLAKDNNKNIWIHGHYNRALMFVDVVLCFETYAEEINAVSFLHNMISVNYNKFIRAPLELYLPDEFCKLISEISHIPLKSNNGSVHDFLTYMNTIWNYPITYKLKGGSNTDEFFMYYLADIDSVFQDINYSQGIKDGQVRRAFEVSFTLRCEFNTIGYFTLNAPNIKKSKMIVPKDPGVITPLFSDYINLDDFHLPVGWVILTWPTFKLLPGENSISIDPVLNESLRTTIDYHLQHGIPVSRFIDVQFRENNRILTEEMFYIDWGKRLLVLDHPDVRRTYRLIIAVSPDYINNLIKELYHLE